MAARRAVRFEGDRCEMVAMAARSARGGAYDAHRCHPITAGVALTPSSCACAVPLTELRCLSGCCQLRITGARGMWTP